MRALGRVRLIPFCDEPYSFAVGVGHRQTAEGSDGPPCLTTSRPRGLSPSCAQGVGHNPALSTTASRSVVPGLLVHAAVRAVDRRAPLASVVTGVGHKEELLPAVRGADVAGGDDASPHGVTAPFEVTRNNVQPRRSEARNVLDDDEARRQLVDDARELPPETRPRIVEPELLAGDAEPLAREPAADEIDWGKMGSSNGSYVVMPCRAWPVPGEHGTTERIALHLPEHRPEAFSLQTELQATDAAEEGADRQSVRSARHSAADRGATARCAASMPACT